MKRQKLPQNDSQEGRGDINSALDPQEKNLDDTNTEFLGQTQATVSQNNGVVNSNSQDSQVDYKDKYLRLLAEYSNFVKQKEAEIQNVVKFANRNLLLKVLDVLDDIEMGLKQSMISEDTRNILNILKVKLEQLLALEGVCEIELKVGDKYDANKCEVVNSVDNQAMSGKIIEILRKGYTISDRILRTAKVVVGK
ncbi:MAG: protein GrpE [Candidatus Dojkabacteria bacterium]|jgi:molecular chaperone GrpE|nr:MAG: protein GrpE [Candidatus Dojkabacteria bacterium]